MSVTSVTAWTEIDEGEYGYYVERHRTENRFKAAIAFVEGKEDHSGTVYTDGERIYSYGSHYTMARHHDGAILVNANDYILPHGKKSMTTQKHMAGLVSVLQGAGYTHTGETFESASETFNVWTKQG